MKKYHIRYNTQHGESDLIWRIFENGVEHLVKQFYISVPVYGESTMENGIKKWNIACDGIMTIKNNSAFINSK